MFFSFAAPYFLGDATGVECKMALYRMIGEGKTTQPILVETVCNIVKEHGAPDWVARTLKQVVGPAQIATVFSATCVVQGQGCWEQQERDD